MEYFEALGDVSWVYKLIASLVILLLTWLIGRAAAKTTHRLLRRDDNDLPANTILINIIRFFIWMVGISVVLYFCFDIEMTGIIAALGIGGIALSLGFQDTLSDLIGGVQLSMGKVVKSGDFIRYGVAEGKVLDVTWHDTKIEDIDGYIHVIPNATLNTSEVVQLVGDQCIDTFLLMGEVPDLEAMRHEMLSRITPAVAQVATANREPLVLFTGSVYGGIQATVRVYVDWFSVKPLILRNAITASVADCIVRSEA